MVREGVECYRNVRARYNGEKRNPWNEPECGHHYARAMSAWSGVLAMSGFRYHAGDRSVEIKAPAGHRCFWATASGWGNFAVAQGTATIHVDHGSLSVQRCTVNGRASAPRTKVSEGEALRV
jgi:non-lysosomal glucosylceramidase